jgi:mutator protein MutT
VSKPVFDVALALVHRDGRWLVTKRYPHAHLGGLWEFPGGKCGPDETPMHTALRELREECRVQAVVQHSLDRLTHDYGDRVVNITPVICRWESGEAQPVASQECRWVSREELARLEMPAINADILRNMPEGN